MSNAVTAVHKSCFLTTESSTQLESSLQPEMGYRITGDRKVAPNLPRNLWHVHPTLPHSESLSQYLRVLWTTKKKSKIAIDQQRIIVTTVTVTTISYSTDSTVPVVQWCQGNLGMVEKWRLYYELFIKNMYPLLLDLYVMMMLK